MKTPWDNLNDPYEIALCKLGFMAAVEMVRDKDDKYGMGIGGTWTSELIADDILEQVGLF